MSVSVNGCPLQVTIGPAPGSRESELNSCSTIGYTGFRYMAPVVQMHTTMRITTLGNMDRGTAWFLGTVALLSSLLAVSAGAQGTPASQDSTQRRSSVPTGYEPPAGMCRIWINDVPATQQPAPTDCVTAVRNRPANARVIFGADLPKNWKGKKQKIDRSRIPENPIIRRSYE